MELVKNSYIYWEFIRNLRKLSLVKLGAAMNITWQQIGKYEHAQNQMNAFRLWQASNILKCKMKYLPSILSLI